MIVRLVKHGWLVGVQVFGAESFGLCDQFAFDRVSRDYGDGFNCRIVGSDCNRAERWLMRPAVPLMSETLAALLGDQPDQEPGGG